MWHLLLVLSSALAVSIEPKAPIRTTETDPQEIWMNIRVNHMMAANTDTYPMRFYYNELSSTAEHIVIVVGGDWEISEGWATGGLAADIADNIGGSLFYTEHRFYGQSRLSEDTSVSHLRFLTIDQALGDLSQFIDYIKSDNFEGGRYKSGKVVLVGCSFGGSLATWMRLTHPHLVQAVVSDGGPLYAREELPEYLQVVSEALRVRGGAGCLQSLEQAVAEVRAASGSPAGLGEITQMFNTCTPFTAASPLDVATFWVLIINALTDLVMYDIDDIPTACATLNAAGTSPMQRLATWYRQNVPENSCHTTQYTDLVATLSNTSYEAPVAYSRLWLYRSCSSLGWLPATRLSPFQNAVPTDFYHRLCADVFGNLLNREFLLSSISRTNLFFAGLSHLPDYVVSVSGTLDPYYSAGPNRTHATTKAPVYIAYDAPRCSSLGSFANSTSEEIRALQLNVLNDIHYLVLGVPFAGASRIISSVMLIIGVAIANIL